MIKVKLFTFPIIAIDTHDHYQLLKNNKHVFLDNLIWNWTGPQPEPLSSFSTYQTTYFSTTSNDFFLITANVCCSGIIRKVGRRNYCQQLLFFS